MTPLSPGSTIGIIGGGQLGRMLAIAAAQLGYRTHVYASGRDSIAAEVAGGFTRAGYDDEPAMLAFAEALDVATYEFENIPAGPVAALGRRVPLHPPVASLEVAQDRLAEKSFLAGLGIAAAPWAAVDDAATLDIAIAKVGVPAILKTRRFGYDGKGQARLAAPADAARAWAAIGAQPAVLESLVAFEAEFSILLCRGQDGEVVFWDAPANVHEGGVLARSTVPCEGLAAAQEAQARTTARRIAEALGHVGVLTVEFFACTSGPLVNEIAPRVHNSGHWTIEGAVTSQFENHIRAICGLPLGGTALTRKSVTMDNLVGEQANGWPAILADPAAHLHLYGKGAPKPGRKMGHVTRVS